MNIIGKKILLRAIEKEDLMFLRDMHNDPEIEKWIGGWSFPLSMKDQEIWFEKIINDKNSLRMIIDLIEIPETIGLTGLWNIDWKNKHATTGIMLINSNKHRRKGYGTDAVMTLMKYAFDELGLIRLDSDIIEYNIPSIKLYIEKCKWKKEGIRYKHVFRSGKFHNRIIIGILAEDYYKLINENHYWE